MHSKARTCSCFCKLLPRSLLLAPPVYVIGDLHGVLDDLEKVLRLYEADTDPSKKLLFVGDYLDRGPAQLELLRRGVDSELSSLKALFQANVQAEASAARRRRR